MEKWCCTMVSSVAWHKGVDALEITILHCVVWEQVCEESEDSEEREGGGLGKSV